MRDDSDDPRAPGAGQGDPGAMPGDGDPGGAGTDRARRRRQRATTRRRRASRSAQHRGQPGTGRSSVRSRRGAALVSLVGVLVVAGIVDTTVGRPARAVTGVAGAPAVPLVAAPPGVESSAWYCAGATGGANGRADGSIALTNTTPAAVRGQAVTASSSGKTAAQAVVVPADGRIVLSPPPSVGGPFVATAVRLSGGGVVAQQSVAGPLGSATTPCAPVTNGSWSFVGGSTMIGDSLELALFNPGATPASVNMTFATPGNLTAPPDLQGVSIPARGLVIEDVGTYVQESPLVATEVTAESGRFVADELELRTAGGNGMALMLGNPSPTDRCWFPVSVVSADVQVNFNVFNATSRPATVQMAANLAQGTASPFALVVPAQSVYSLDASAQSRLPKMTLFSMTVTSRNGVPVVVGRSVRTTAPSPATSFDDASATCVSATRWAVADPPPLPTQFTLGIQDAGSVAAHVQVRALRDGHSVAVPSMSGIARPGVPLTITVPAALATNAVPLIVTASVPVVVEQDGADPGTGGLTSSAAIPLG